MPRVVPSLNTELRCDRITDPKPDGAGSVAGSRGKRRPRCPASTAAGVLAASAMLLLSGETATAQEAYVSAAVTTEGAGTLGLGAIVGAVVAGAFALLERFRRD